MLWPTACQAPLFMGFSRQEYWSGLPSSPPGNLLDPGMELTPLMSPTLAGRFFTTSASWEAHHMPYNHDYQSLINKNVEKIKDYIVTTVPTKKGKWISIEYFNE